MTTFATLLSDSRKLLGDTGSATFADATLESWINQAVADLNNFFPRRITYEISASAAVHEYELETNTLAVLSAEYPADQQPPEYLNRLPRTDPAFWLTPYHYDVILRNDATSANPPQIVISASPAGAETLRLELTATHTQGTGSTVVTVLDRHLPIIYAFVRWKAAQMLSTQESIDPDAVHPQVGQAELNAVRAERQYRSTLDAAIQAESSSSVAAWRMGKRDRVY